MVLWTQSTTKDHIIYQSWKRTSIYLLVIHSTDYYTTNLICQTTALCQIFHEETNTTQRASYFIHHINLSRKGKFPIHNFEMPNQKNNNTCLGAYLYSAGTQHGSLHQSSVTMHRVTDFILRANTGTGVSRSQHRKNSGEVLENMQVNGPEKCGNSEEEIPGSKRSMDSYIPTYFRL